MFYCLALVDIFCNSVEWFKQFWKRWIYGTILLSFEIGPLVKEENVFDYVDRQRHRTSDGNNSSPEHFVLEGNENKVRQTFSCYCNKSFWTKDHFFKTGITKQSLVESGRVW